MDSPQFSESIALRNGAVLKHTKDRAYAKVFYPPNRAQGFSTPPNRNRGDAVDLAIAFARTQGIFPDSLTESRRLQDAARPNLDTPPKEVHEVNAP